jgi:cell division septation protein DedD
MSVQMNSVGLGISRRWNPIGIMRASAGCALALSLAALLMFAAASSAEADKRVAQVAGNSTDQNIAELGAAPQGAVIAQSAHEDLGGRGGGFVVQVSAQRSEEEAQASYQALQGKYPMVLAERAPIIKRVEIVGKSVFYRVLVGSFDTAEEASQFCNRLRAAGGHCVTQRN